MITGINSAVSKNISFSQNMVAREEKKSRMSKYKDSFIRHARESAPVIMGATALWALMDKSMGKMPFMESLYRNSLTFFIPVTVASSGILACLENNKDEKNQLNGLF